MECSNQMQILLMMITRNLMIFFLFAYLLFLMKTLYFGRAENAVAGANNLIHVYSTERGRAYNN